ncbi:MAG: glycosyl hydrolase family 17 protein [Pseudomonadota bacterium]
MSQLYKKTLSLAGINTEGMSTDELKKLVAAMLENKIHGLCFSPYIEGQEPGSKVTEAQIRERLSIIAPFCRNIRTFSCTDGHEAIPAIAKEMGLGTMVGVWLEDDAEKNEEELANALEIAKQGHIDILAVGNEVLLRGDLSEDQLLDYINRAKEGAPGVDVGYVDAYFEFVDHPRITEACDVLLANCYPFWEGCPAEWALLYMKEMYRKVQAVGGGKRIVVSETGWPDKGTPEQGAVPSYHNAVKYLVDSVNWSEQDGIELFYFSSFDEAWKVAAEGDVGAYWGLWDKDGQPKYW